MLQTLFVGHISDHFLALAKEAQAIENSALGHPEAFQWDRRVAEFSGPIVLPGSESPVVRLLLSEWRQEVQAGWRIVAGSGAGCRVKLLRRPLPQSARAPRRRSFALSALETAFFSIALRPRGSVAGEGGIAIEQGAAL